jgi:hypothetical protein
MKYLLLIYGNEAGMLAASKETVGQMMAAYGAYERAIGLEADPAVHRFLQQRRAELHGPVS